MLGERLQTTTPGETSATAAACSRRGSLRHRGADAGRTLPRFATTTSARASSSAFLRQASETTLAQLSEIAAATTRCKAILVMPSRFEGDPLASEWRPQLAEATFTTLDVAPLQDEDARALASGLLAASSSFVERCLERAAGNPLFLEQLLAETQQSPATPEVPGSVQSLIQARVDQVDVVDKSAIQAASVLGQRFRPYGAAVPHYWDAAERHAELLEDYTRAEPLAWAERVIA